MRYQYITFVFVAGYERLFSVIFGWFQELSKTDRHVNVVALLECKVSEAEADRFYLFIYLL
jgi:hypothetical protein